MFTVRFGEDPGNLSMLCTRSGRAVAPLRIYLLWDRRVNWIEKDWVLAGAADSNSGEDCRRHRQSHVAASFQGPKCHRTRSFRLMNLQLRKPSAGPVDAAPFDAGPGSQAVCEETRYPGNLEKSRELVSQARYTLVREMHESLREFTRDWAKNFGRGTADEQLPATTDRIGCSFGERCGLGSDLEAGYPDVEAFAQSFR